MACIACAKPDRKYRNTKAGQVQVEDDAAYRVVTPGQQSLLDLLRGTLDREGTAASPRGQAKQLGSDSRSPRDAQEIRDCLDRDAAVPAPRANHRQQPLIAPALERRFADADGRATCLGLISSCIVVNAFFQHK